MAFWQGKKTAVTGATGFVGYHVALALQRQGADVVALARPTSDVQRLAAAGVRCVVASMDDRAALTREMSGAELIFHAAGAVGFGADWAGYFRTNVQGTVNLLDAARAAGVRRVVYISSIVAIAGSTTPVFFDENAAWNLQGIRVPYIFSKRRAEEAALKANGAGLEVVVANPASVVGPGDHTNSEFGGLCKEFWKGRLPFHFGGGNNFVDVRDVACGLLLAAERGRPGERYLLTGENRTYIEFFSDLCRAAKRTIPRMAVPNALAWWVGRLSERLHRTKTKRPYFTSAQATLMGMYFFFESSKARRELGFVARPLRETLGDAYRFWGDAVPAPGASGMKNGRAETKDLAWSLIRNSGPASVFA